MTNEFAPPPSPPLEGAASYHRGAPYRVKSVDRESDAELTSNSTPDKDHAYQLAYYLGATLTNTWETYVEQTVSYSDNVFGSKEWERIDE